MANLACMLAMQASPLLKENYLFADHLVLDDSPTRDFYRDLLRGLAHKNNNVLAVVQGFSSLILMDKTLDPELADNVQQMRSSAQSSSSLSERVLTAGGVARISSQSLQLDGFLPLLEDRLEELVKKEGASFTMTTSASSLPPVRADATRLKELIYELVQNAAEAAGPIHGGSVKVWVGSAEDFGLVDDPYPVHMFVRNNGSWIEESELREVYRPFHTSKGSTHFGIGLTSAAVVAGQMKMRLGIASEPNDTSVWLAMPRGE